MAQTSGFDPTNQVKTCFDCKMFDVNWVACLNRENGPGGMPSHEALSVSPQGALEISSVVGQPPSMDRNHFNTQRVVAESHKCDERCEPSSQRKIDALNINWSGLTAYAYPSLGDPISLATGLPDHCNTPG